MVDADDTHTGLWHKLPTGELKTTNHTKYHQIMAHTKEEALNIKLTLEILVGEINIFIRLVCIVVVGENAKLSIYLWTVQNPEEEEPFILIL